MFKMLSTQRRYELMTALAAVMSDVLIESIISFGLIFSALISDLSDIIALVSGSNAKYTIFAI
jgi:hypothetical protein